MKRLLLNRHAEAATIKGLDDFERPLTTHGIKQAQELAGNINEQKLIPKLWVSSTALRAQATAQIIGNALAIDQTDSSGLIYEASEQTLLRLINQWDNKYDFVGLTGHNPGISYLFYMLCTEVKDVPPCTALLMEFETDNWAHINAGMGALKWYHTPA
ncbi:SixA phosphatase family protein [Mucilaginibacter sp.]